ncbi:hypothetical protein ACFL0Y_03735 [Patescibacteria group bacterium]
MSEIIHVYPVPPNIVDRVIKITNTHYGERGEILNTARELEQLANSVRGLAPEVGLRAEAKLARTAALLPKQDNYSQN